MREGRGEGEGEGRSEGRNKGGGGGEEWMREVAKKWKGGRRRTERCGKDW